MFTSAPRAQRRSWILIVLAVGTAACTVPPAVLGPTPEGGVAKLDAVLASFEESYTNVQRSPMVVMAGAKLDRTTFVPSLAYGDASIWTSAGDDTRALTVGGSFRAGRYVVATEAAEPTDLGASRRDIRLDRVSREDFRWSTSIVQTLGPLTVDDIDRFLAIALSQAATHSGAALRAQSGRRYPGVAAVLGPVLSLDSVRTGRAAGQPTRVRLVLGLHVAGLEPRYASYAAAVQKTILPLRLRCVVTDPDGHPWARLEIASGRLVTTFAATRDGHFAPLTGRAQVLPDSLVLSADVSTQVWMITVGAHDILADVVSLRRPHAAGWRFAFRREPAWDLPLALDHLVRMPLARPFADSGSSYQVVIVDSAGRSTLFERRGVLAIEESLIMRWLSSVAGAVTGAYSDTATREEEAFFASVLRAARADLQAPAVLANDAFGVADPTRRVLP